MKKVNKIDKAEFDSLFSDTITKKDYDSIIAKIEQRCSYIVNTFSSHLEWWDFNNLGYEDEIPGSFDPEKYKNYIGYSGTLSVPKIYKECRDFPCDSCPEFPTRWLWEDFEKEIEEQVKIAEEKLKQKAEKQKEMNVTKKSKKETIQNSIKSKLTNEELKYIKFKS